MAASLSSDLFMLKPTYTCFALTRKVACMSSEGNIGLELYAQRTLSLLCVSGENRQEWLFGDRLGGLCSLASGPGNPRFRIVLCFLPSWIRLSSPQVSRIWRTLCWARRSSPLHFRKRDLGWPSR